MESAPFPSEFLELHHHQSHHAGAACIIESTGIMSYLRMVDIWNQGAGKVTSVVLVGAGGKMGVRLADLKRSSYEPRFVENDPGGSTRSSARSA